MMYSPRKSIPTLNNLVIDLASPMNLSYGWNMGSLLGICLILQLSSGMLLAMHYIPNMPNAFESVTYITRDLSFGWVVRNMHANTASLFFFLMYLHILRNLMHSSFNSTNTWLTGVTIYIAMMATAFMGYLLPWGQMSFWGATVITNLFSAIPYVGPNIVVWLWGGYSVSGPTLTRFFAIHFVLPFVITALTAMHLIFLHSSGSQGPLGDQSSLMKIPFHLHFSHKDGLGAMIIFMLIIMMTFFYPTLMVDPENFLTANPLITPTHIKPEWYFLWAYAILRSVPNKLGGVTIMFMAVLILYLLPFTHTTQTSTKLNLKYFLALLICMTFILLTWIGGSPVEAPYIIIGQTLTCLYFILMLAFPTIKP